MPRESKLVREKREAREAAAAAAEQPEVNGVIVVRQETPEGGIIWAVGELVGNVTPDQVSTGLRLAAKRVDEDLLGPKTG